MKDLSTPMMDEARHRYRDHYREFDRTPESTEGWYIREVLRELDAELAIILNQ